MSAGKKPLERWAYQRAQGNRPPPGTIGGPLPSVAMGKMLTRSENQT